MTCGSVESSTSGTVAWVAKRRGDLVHVGGAVAADVVDADVEDVGALLHLVAGHRDAGVPVAVEHRLAELLGAVGVGALADDEERRVLLEGHVAVDRRGAGLVHRGAGRRRRGPGRPRRRRRMCSGVVPQQPPTTWTPSSVTKRRVVLGQLVGREVVVHLAVDHRRQAGVGQAGDRHAGVLGQVAEVLAHLGRAGGAVEADDVGPQRVEGGEGGADLGAGQHAAGQLDGDLDLERHLAARGRPWPGGRRSWPP